MIISSAQHWRTKYSRSSQYRNKPVLDNVLDSRPLSPSVTALDTSDLESSAPRKSPLLSEVPSSWLSCLLSQSVEDTGVTSSVNLIPFPARSTESVDPFTSVLYLPHVEPVSYVDQSQRSLCRWRDLRMSTPGMNIQLHLVTLILTVTI